MNATKVSVGDLLPPKLISNRFFVGSEVAKLQNSSIAYLEKLK